jgi:hypothetical protein
MKLSDSVLKARAAAKVAKAADDQGWMEAVLRMGDGATFEEWCAQMHAIKGWPRQTFKRRLAGFKQQHPELAGGRWRSDPYILSTHPTAAMAERVITLRTWLPPRNPRDLDRIARNLEQIAKMRGFGPEPGHTGTFRTGNPSEDLIAKAKAHIKSTRDGVG